MLLTFGDMSFLSAATEKDKDGRIVAKPGLPEEQKARLLDIDAMNLMTYGEHLIKNYSDLQ